MIVTTTRDRVWEYLRGFIGDIPEAMKVIVLGDLNANLHTRREGEENHIGPNIYGRGAEFLRNRNYSHQQRRPQIENTSPRYLEQVT